MGTLSPTYDVLFSEGDYYIVKNDNLSISFERDSVIIHVCPKRDGDTFHNMIITMPNGDDSHCYYCKTDIPEAIQTLYKLQNFEYFAGDNHEQWTGRPGQIWEYKP